MDSNKEIVLTKRRCGPYGGKDYQWEAVEGEISDSGYFAIAPGDGGFWVIHTESGAGINKAYSLSKARKILEHCEDLLQNQELREEYLEIEDISLAIKAFPTITRYDLTHGELP